MSDLARQELKAWIKAQREALPERRESWAHGAAETLADLERELDRIYGHQNAAPRESPLTHQARVMGARIFAANMVEASTADDWQDLPMHLRDKLAEWCESYIGWQQADCVAVPTKRAECEALAASMPEVGCPCRPQGRP